MSYIKFHGGNLNVHTRDVKEGIHLLNEMPINIHPPYIHGLNELSANGLNELSANFMNELYINVFPCDVRGLNELSFNGLNELLVKVCPRNVYIYLSISN